MTNAYGALTVCQALLKQATCMALCMRWRSKKPEGERPIQSQIKFEESLIWHTNTVNESERLDKPGRCQSPRRKAGREAKKAEKPSRAKWPGRWQCMCAQLGVMAGVEWVTKTQLSLPKGLFWEQSLDGTDIMRHHLTKINYWAFRNKETPQSNWPQNIFLSLLGEAG